MSSWKGKKIKLDKLRSIEAGEDDIIVMEDCMELTADAVENLGTKIYEQTGAKLLIVPDIDKVGVLKAEKLGDDDEDEEEESTQGILERTIFS